jgi:hypothetical protein
MMRWPLSAMAMLACAPAPLAHEVTIASVPAPSAEVRRNAKTARFDDCEWAVLEVRDVGKTIEPKAGFDYKAQTSVGHFVMIHYTLTNVGAKQGMVMNRGVIRDAMGREFGPIEYEPGFVPIHAKTLNLDMIDPGVTKDYWTVIEVPADATDMQLQVRGFAAIGPSKRIPLGI